MSLSVYLLAELRRFPERPSPEELRRRLGHPRPVVPAESAVAAVLAERDAQ